MHLFEHNGTVYTPNGAVDVTPADVDAINAETNGAELAHWKTAPELFAPAYYVFPAETQGGLYRASFRPLLGGFNTDKRAIVTTWQGSELGYISDARVYRGNFGGRIVALRVRGNNGANYYGRASWDNGSIIRLRRVKE